MTSQTGHLPRRALPGAPPSSTDLERAVAGPRRRRPGRAWGVAAVVVPYLFGFSVTSWTAVDRLAGGDGGLGLSPGSGLALVATGTGVGLALALVLTRSVLGLGWPALGMAGPRSGRLRRGLVLFCAAYFPMWVAGLVFGRSPGSASPHRSPARNVPRSTSWPTACWRASARRS